MLKNPNILPRQARDEQVEHRKRLAKDTFLHQATERLQSTSRGRKSARSTFEASELWTQISRIYWRTETLALRHAWCCRGTPRVVWRRTCMQRPDLYIKTNILPRHARDKHRENSKTDAVNSKTGTCMLIMCGRCCRAPSRTMPRCQVSINRSNRVTPSL
jgi:hypothetical protein